MKFSGGQHPGEPDRRRGRRRPAQNSADGLVNGSISMNRPGPPEAIHPAVTHLGVRAATPA